MSRLTVGVGVPNFGPAPSKVGLDAIAIQIEEAGFDGAWLFDHIVLVEGASSAYPYSADGEFFLDADEDWYECITTLGHLAAVTDSLTLGIGICIVPLRDPVLLAKQLATIDQLAAGRVVVGVGTGWLAEEFEALGVEFESRGERLVSGMSLLRACWEGRPPAGRYGPYRIPEGVYCRPTPKRRIPLLVGGNSTAALDALATHGDGWLGAVPAGGLPPAQLRSIASRIDDRLTAAGREDADIELGLRLAVRATELGSDALIELILGYVDAGLTRLVVDFGWRNIHDGRERLDRLASTITSVRNQL